jgi:hypothetical protein
LEHYFPCFAFSLSIFWGLNIGKALILGEEALPIMLLQVTLMRFLKIAALILLMMSMLFRQSRKEWLLVQ